MLKNSVFVFCFCVLFNGCAPVDVSPNPRCGDGICQEGEDEETCSVDCRPTGPYCGDSVCNGDENYSTCPGDCDCQPECGTRQCGPDPVCGQSCGTCADTNPCTNDVCNASGTCDFEPIDFEILACYGDVGLSICFEGAEQNINCVTYCIDEGHDLISACSDDEPACGCGNYTTTSECSPGVTECTTDAHMVRCVDGTEYGASENFWFVMDCNEACIDAGYDFADSCGYNDSGEATCYCDNHPCQPDCTNRRCGPDPVCGESCGSCPGSEVCVQDSGGSHCECPDSCRPYGSSVCCGFPFCAGDCIGNPCC